MIDFGTFSLEVTTEHYCSVVTKAHCTTQSVVLRDNVGHKRPSALIYIHKCNRKPKCPP